MNSGVLIENAAHLLDCLWSGLSRVTRAYDQLGFNAVNMRALACVHADADQRSAPGGPKQGT
jgi:hypothetical protein